MNIAKSWREFAQENPNKADLYTGLAILTLLVIGGGAITLYKSWTELAALIVISILTAVAATALLLAAFSRKKLHLSVKETIVICSVLLAAAFITYTGNWDEFSGPLLYIPIISCFLLAVWAYIRHGSQK